MSDGIRLVVGVEVHVQLATDTKLFCRCPVNFGAEANSNVCPVCMGHPGALPVMNRRAVDLAVRAGLSLGCEIAPQGKAQWDRKNYFYPDLPKGYQITQYEYPLCEKGMLKLSGGKQVRIRRAHLEEDTGKSSHAADGATLIDYNRCGTPLLEIVTEPNLSTSAQVEEYLRLLQQAMRDIGVSECSMEKGEMRCEPNVNLVREDKWATGISELKNLNSFAACRDAVEYEMERQKNADDWHPPHETPPRHTLGWDVARKVSVHQRSKESAADYRYFPEPDLPVLPRAALKSVVRDATKALEDLEASRETAAVDLKEAASRLGLTKDQASLLLERDVTGGLFRATADAAVEAGVPVEEAGRTLAGWFQGPLLGWVNNQGDRWSAVKATAADLATALVVQRERKATAQVVKEHLLSGDWLAEGGDPLKHLDGKGLLGGSDDGAVRTACEEVLAANPDIVAKIRDGKGAAKGALVGQVMKKTRGTANPGDVNKLLDELLGG